MVVEGPNHRGAAAFARLGRSVIRRPLVPIAGWIVLIVVAAPFLSHLGAVTTSSAEKVPANSPSAIADAKLARLFPNSTGGSSTILLFVDPQTGSYLTGAAGQRLILNVTARLDRDRGLSDVAAVRSVYTAYTAYLAGETRLAAAAIAEAQAAPPNLTTDVEQTALLLWGTPALFVHNWYSLVVNSTGPPWNASNAPAYRTTETELSSSSGALAVLSAFYSGYDGASTGFNGSTADCAAAYPPVASVVACADASARENVLPLVPQLAGTNASLDDAVLAGMGVENSTSATAVRSVASTVVSAASGLAASWVDRVWSEFPRGPPTAAAADRFANATVNGTTLAHEPLPVPAAITTNFVDAAGTASIVAVDFTVPDDATNASGGHPVYADLGRITTAVDQVLTTSEPAGNVGFYQTGPAPLDQLTSQATSSSLVFVLPLTVVLLLGITMLYFRSPLAPLVAFAGLGAAILLGMGGTVLLGTLVTHIDSTAIVLEEVFVLGIGTDYSIFLLARYREELVRGRSSDEAIVAAVTWAGQSIATSGSTAILVTVALALSGVALLSQWGMVLAVAILITILVALTLLPACLKLLGPRIFWPITGPRFEKAARAANERSSRGSTYFYRAARAAERRPRWIVVGIVLASIPVVAVALQVPVSYDFYDQLPSGHMATEGLAELGQYFGPGYAVPSYALVSFSSPLRGADNTTNASEFSDLAQLTSIATAEAGIATVRSPVGPYGASLLTWEHLAAQPPAVRANLIATLSEYVGTDGRTVLLPIQTNATGLSFGAVSAVGRVQTSFDAFASGHPAVTSVEFGGGAPTINDLANQTDFATLVMLGAVTVGLVLVLLVVLRSWIIAGMAVATIGLSISWAWALSDLVLQQLLGIPLFFYVRTLLIMLVLGLGIDYNIFLLTRVREERLKGRTAEAATVEAVGRTGGIITAAAIILASAFGALLVADFTLIRAIGFAVAIAIVMDAMVVRTYFVPAALQLLGERVWTLSGRKPGTVENGPAAPAGPDGRGRSS